jgi:endonuclease/exonuclease/phosphatase family metal-dependent hydrolase
MALMRNILVIAVLLLSALSGSSCGEKPRGTQAGIKVCAFNIRYDNPNDGFNQWKNRKENVVAFLAVENPDIIGFQEVIAGQLQYLEKGMPIYSRVGVGREDGKDQGEFAPILFRKDRFMLLDSGNFWLSETPAIPSKGWDAVIKRICTYAILKDNERGEEIHVYNTHFSHVGAEARLKSATLIIDSIAARSADNRVILTGDFNTEPGSPPYDKIIESGLRDSYDCDLRLGPVGTFNGFNLTGTFDRRIDFVFHRGFTTERYITSSIVIDNQYLSDHFPVIAILKYLSENGK